VALPFAESAHDFDDEDPRKFWGGQLIIFCGRTSCMYVLASYRQDPTPLIPDLYEFMFFISLPQGNYKKMYHNHSQTGPKINPNQVYFKQGSLFRLIRTFKHFLSLTKKV
jgi:hypothetical protein